MSYNLNNIKILSGELTMSARDIAVLHNQFEYLPSSCFLRDMFEDARIFNDETQLAIEQLEWCSEGSGHSYDNFEKFVLPKINGRASIMEIWECGDSVTTYDIVDGKKQNIKTI